MTDKLCRISLFSAILACTAGMPSASFADSRANSSYAGAYNQVLAMQQQQEYIDSVETPQVQTASATATLPIEVEDARLAAKIKNNTSDSVTMRDLERCSMIDIRGVFKWGIPQSGMRQTLQPQCMAVVNLIDYNTKEILATTTVAAGDAIKCNIDEFPESGYLPALANVILPADNPPTEKDVEKALNKEQKQNAGFKIAAAAIIGGLAGNALAPKPSGDSKLLGTSKTQLADTAIGALAAGGIMAASSYSGKVAGETIKSGAVNATAGMLVANMGAGLSNSNSVLATTKCTVDKKEHDCVIGHFYKKSKDLSDDKETTYYITNTGNSVYACNNKTRVCSNFNSKLQNVVLIGNIKLASTNPADFGPNGKFANRTKYIINNKVENEAKEGTEEGYYQVESAWVSSPVQMAYAVFNNLSSKAFGYKVSDFEKSLNKKVTGYYVRYNNTTTVGDRLDLDKDGNELAEDSFVFTPAARSSEDGGIIDLSNEARAKATMAGAGAGAALGGFVGYQGAQSEISDRLVTALNDYRLSLENFYCTIGGPSGRFLSFYNGYAEVPPLQASTSTDNQE